MKTVSIITSKTTECKQQADSVVFSTKSPSGYVLSKIPIRLYSHEKPLQTVFSARMRMTVRGMDDRLKDVGDGIVDSRWNTWRRDK